METTISQSNRRTFIKTMAVASAGLASAGIAGADQAVPTVLEKKLRLGFDNFSIRALGLKAPALLDYAASLKLDSILISDLDAYESFFDSYLKDVGRKAKDLDILLHAGTWSICPTSVHFKNKWGTAEEHLALGIRVAKSLGSPVLRVILGMWDDRKTPGGIEARMRDTIKVLKTGRQQALDSGVKVAVENHAGDMQAWELVSLIEEAGKDYVAATLDAGNACWTMEDPMSSLEILAPYTVTTGLRDSMVWEYSDGAKVQWTATGEGLVDQKAYFKRFAEICPGVPANLEIISGFAKDVPYLQKEFWKQYPKARATDFVKFLEMARRGKAIGPGPSNDKEYQKSQLESSLKYCKEELGLGLKA